MSVNRDQPSFEIVTPPYCDHCGHYHFTYDKHFDVNKMCGERCCNRPDNDDYCGDCGHHHVEGSDCPEPGNCGDHRCCH